MAKKLLLLILFLLLSPAVILAQPSIKVAVTPFAVYSQEDLAYLSPGLQEMAINHLLQRGIESLPAADVSASLKGLKPKEINEQKARDLGRALSVDYVIFGSLTKVGSRFSLDIKMVDVHGRRATAKVFTQGDSLESVNAVVEKLTQEIVLQVSGSQKVERIEITGNERIETDAIKRVIETRPGEIFSEPKLSEDLKRIYAMEFFEDVKVGVEDGPTGRVVTFQVVEKPTIQEIEISGYRMLDREKIMEVLGFNVYSIANPKKIVESVENIKKAYREKGYYNAEVKYTIKDLDKKKVALSYDITEHGRVYIKKIRFNTNQAFTNRQLRGKMETKQWNLLSWATSDGILKEEVLKTDAKRLTAWYYQNGYIKARVGEPQVTVEKDGLYVDIAIEEGPQFKYGQVSVSGDLVVPQETILKSLKSKKGDIFSRKDLQEDIQTITDLIADKGYAFCDINPKITESDNDLTADVDFQIDKKGLVNFERISIVGNDKTRDKVIRRELKAKEGDVYSADGLRLSQRNLDRLGYFKEVNIAKNKGSSDDKMDLEIRVQEQPTGSFSVGAGYSSFNSVFGTASISENNLFGLGQQIKLEGTIGARSADIVLSFTEPWLFDIPLNAGIDLFKTRVYYDDYTKNGAGFALRAGYPLFESVSLSGRYRLEFADVTDVTSTASTLIQEIKGKSTTSSLMSIVRRDTRNKFFNPTAGSDNNVSFEVAGGLLGGTNAFYRTIGTSQWYLTNPLFDDSAFMVRGRIGHIAQGDGKLPAYEKFYSGGIDAVRGYKWGDITVYDPITGDRIGGQKLLLFNAEFTFPIIQKSGLIGVVFFDQGNVWDKNTAYSLSDLKRSFGGGFRYNSPLGPMRLEYGRVINPKPGDPTGNWEFAVGGTF